MDDEPTTPPSDESPEGFEALRPFFEGAEVPAPEDLRKSTPFLRVKSPIDEMASTVADFLRGKNLLFRRGMRDVGTIDEATGEWLPMTPTRLLTWLPKTAGLIPITSFDKETGRASKGQLEVGQAAAILADDELLLKLPLIEAVNPVPMPVFYEVLDERGLESRKGFRKIAPSPLGYHAATKTYTIHGGLHYDESMDPDEACKYLKELFRWFPMDRRSLAVQLAAMLSVYCRRIYVGRCPMFVFTSNLGGSGKSKLAEVAISPVHGRPSATGYDQYQQKDLKSDLDSVVNTYRPVLFFDDFELPPDVQIKSSHLNRFITGDTWESRTFGKNDERRAIENEVTVMMTGIKLNLEGQLRRRTLFVDLFARQKVGERKLPKEAILITSSFIRNPDNRRKLLSAMWALVKFWDDNDRPVSGVSPLESFEDWSDVVAAIVMPGFGNCLEEFEAPDAGDVVTAEFRKLAECLITKYAVTPTKTRTRITMRDIIREARLQGLFSNVLGTLEQTMTQLEQNPRHKWRVTDADGNPLMDDHGFERKEDELTKQEKEQQAAEWTDRSLDSAWGKAWKKGCVDGLFFRVDGRFWEFGKRGSGRGSVFEITWVEHVA